MRSPRSALVGLGLGLGAFSSFVQSARADEPPSPAPYQADFTYPPAELLCAGNVLVAARQDVVFLQRGQPALHSSVHHSVSVLRSATIDGKLVLAAASAREVARLSQGKWSTLTPPLGDGEEIRDVAFARSGAMFVLTGSALYTEAGTEWTKTDLGDAVGTYAVVASTGQLHVLGYARGDRDQPVVLALAGGALAKRTFPGLTRGAVFSGVWPSPLRPVLWTIAEDGGLRELDVVAGSLKEHRPKIGALHGVGGVGRAQGDVVVMTGDVVAHFDGKGFHYPRGEGGPISCFDAVGHDVYVTDASGLERIAVRHPWLESAGTVPELVLPEDAAKGASPSRPIAVADPSAGGPRAGERDADADHDSVGAMPSIRVGYGWGRFPREPKPDQAQLDVMFGLRFWGKKDKSLLDAPQLFFWPEAGYTSGPDHYATLAASVHYGTPLVVSGGPFAAGLLSTEGRPGIRSGVRGSVLAGLFQLELAHQWVAIDRRGEHGFRVVGSIDLFAGGIAVLLIGVPSSILASVLIGLAR